MDVKRFTKDYIKNLKNLLDAIDEKVVESIIDEIEKLLFSKGRLYILGNGGSSATASHMVNDLGAGLRRRDIINLDVISLADNTPVITAISNDIGYENIFFMQMKGLIEPKDTVLAISCSGNSPNIIKAVEYAKEVGCKIIGVTGFDGGRLRELADIKFHVNAPKGEYGLVEDVHMVLDHIIYSYFIQKDA
jgi:D-sedoheptulose 7-phosphate isomerase